MPYIFYSNICVFAVGDNWSAFEHTLTSLSGGLSTGSFLSLAPLNSRNKVLNRGSYSSSRPSVQNENFSLSEMLQPQICPFPGNDANSGKGSLSEMLTSGSAVVIGDGDEEKPTTAVSSASSQLTTDNSFDRVGITSTEIRTLKDINCSQIVSSLQALQGHTSSVSSSKHSSGRKDQCSINRPVSGKENTRPTCGSRSELSRLNARNCLDLNRQIPYTETQELSSANHWRSPLRLTVSSAKKDCLAQSQSLHRDGLHESAGLDMNEGFSALSVVSNDSFDSCVDQRPPSRFSEDCFNGESDEVKVYKRSSSTPVKDQSSQPVRFRRQQRRNSSEANREQRTSSLQNVHEMLPQAVDISESHIHEDEKSLTAQAVQRTEMQTQADMADSVHLERLSVGALSTNSLFDDSVMIGDVSYESTVLLPLPTHVSADSARLQQETMCPEVGTQTSFLSSTYSANSKDTSGYQKDKLQHLHTRNTDSQPLSSGNC